MKAVAKLAVAALLVAGSPLVSLAQTTVNNYGSLITSLQAETPADLSTFTATSTVNCVKVSTLQADATADAAALDTALTTHATKVTSLKTSIEGNADLKAKLEAQACPLEDVVAITTGADGSFTVFIDDRA